jgi:hypothetical protein
MNMTIFSRTPHRKTRRAVRLAPMPRIRYYER